MKNKITILFAFLMLAGIVYDFAYGLNWKGVIKDARMETYKKQ